MRSCAVPSSCFLGLDLGPWGMLSEQRKQRAWGATERRTDVMSREMRGGE